MTAQPATTARVTGPRQPRPPFHASVREDGAVLVGVVVYADSIDAADERAVEALLGSQHPAGSWERSAAFAVNARLAEHRAAA